MALVCVSITATSTGAAQAEVSPVDEGKHLCNWQRLNEVVVVCFLLSGTSAR